MKKITALMMATLLGLTLLTGCTSGEKSEVETTDGAVDAAAEQAADEEGGNEKKVIGVSLMTLQYEFFQDVKAGIEGSLGDEYEIVFNDPALDLQKQITAIENFCAQGVDAIILNAVDSSGVVPALDTAEEKKIPVITVDMKPESGTYATYIGSDNRLGGELAARWAAKELLADKEVPKIVLLENPLSSASVERIEGFKTAMAEVMPGAVIVAQQGADTREAFMSIMEDALTANKEVDLVFSYSAQGGLGAYDAIQASGRNDEISVIGFDASEEEQTAIAEGGCYKGSIIQFPDKLGQTCVDAVAKVLSGETLDTEIGVEVGVYTAEGILYASDLE